MSVTVEKMGPITTAIMNRPEARNAVNPATARELYEAFVAFDGDAEASVAVVPSVYEGFGLPAGEAMACGVPVVSTDGGALPEVVGDAGVIVPVRDAEALAAAIAGLLCDPQRREALSRRGRQRIEERFCWHLCAQQMTDYYRRVIADANG